ncbi:hypothetical protein LUZ60_007041 [Juncus effusus]|nr:hypothetical protein LUZ60_007041 [Juncus effusus]
MRNQNTQKLLTTSSYESLLLHYRHAKLTGLAVPSELLPSIFKSVSTVGSLELGTNLHADAIKTGLDSFTSTSNSITSFYIKSNLLSSAVQLFYSSVSKNSVSWNGIIHGFMSHGEFFNGLRLFREARVSEVFKPNMSTLVLSIQAYWKLQEIEEGLKIHGFVLKKGYLGHLSVANSLITMYGKFYDIDSAQQVFDEIPERDFISWSALISAYAQSDEAINAIELFKDMIDEKFMEIDGLTVVNVLQACCNLKSIMHGKLIHGLVIFRGFETDIFVANSLIDVYSKCDDTKSAYKVFVFMPERKLVSWNCIFSGLVHADLCSEAFELFDSMIKERIERNEVTLVTLLQLCKKEENAMFCKSIHGLIVRKMLFSNLPLLNSLLDAYAKCNLMEFALRFFEQIGGGDVITWSTMVSGYASCGRPNEAIAFFKESQREFGNLNLVIMLGLLEACGTLSDLNLSKCAHGVSIKSGLHDDLAVGTTLVDMYGKCGDLNASNKVFDEMPERNVITYNAMIGAFGMNGSGKEALSIFEKMKDNNIEPNGAIVLTVLSACSHAGLLNQGLEFFKRLVRDFSFQPQLEHYSCIIDMLGRAGKLEEAMDFINKMPANVKAGASAWASLLSACINYNDLKIGEGVAKRVIELEPSNSAGYLMALNIYAKCGLVDEMKRIRSSMREKRVKVLSGYSLIHVGNESHKFVSFDVSHPKCREIYAMVEFIHLCMKLVQKDEFAINK